MRLLLLFWPVSFFHFTYLQRRDIWYNNNMKINEEAVH